MKLLVIDYQAKDDPFRVAPPPAETDRIRVERIDTSVESAIEKLFQNSFELIFIGHIHPVEIRKLKKIIAWTQQEVMVLEGSNASREMIIALALSQYKANADKPAISSVHIRDNPLQSLSQSIS